MLTEAEPATPTDRYLGLMKQVLTRYDLEEGYRPLTRWRALDRLPVLAPWRRWIERSPVQLVRRVPWDPGARREGRDWPEGAETMIGLRRLDNLERCVRRVVAEGVPGDLIETGVWRGGASIFMKAVLEALGDRSRSVWVADSFRGLPRPDEVTNPADRGDRHWRRFELAVGIETVRANFAKFGLLDDRVRFLEGWFADTLPEAPIERLAVMRLDGDLYGSTMDALGALYPRLSPGGFVIVDDWGAIPACRRAVEDFRAGHGITEAIEEIDWTGAFWRRSRG